METQPWMKMYLLLKDFPVKKGGFPEQWWCSYEKWWFSHRKLVIFLINILIFKGIYTISYHPFMVPPPRCVRFAPPSFDRTCGKMARIQVVAKLNLHLKTAKFIEARPPKKEMKGGWFQPFGKRYVKMGIFPQIAPASFKGVS